MSRATGGIAAHAKRLYKAARRHSPLLKQWDEDRRASRLKAAYDAVCRSNPVEPRTIVFESYVGTGYSCSPKALYEAILKDPSFDDCTLIWAMKEPEAYAAVPALERATLVKWGSPEYFAAYARAAWWLCNTAVQPQVFPRAGQTYLQTWHGTPFKRFGCDIVIPSQATPSAIARRLKRWRTSASKFTYLLSQSPFATDKLASALGLDPRVVAGTVLELGYPRDDALATADAVRIERLRADLDLPEGVRVVLYAPTWREEQRRPGPDGLVDLGLDFERLRSELGSDHIVLFRAHFMIADSFDFERYGGFVHDVSAVDDINDLYLVADVLVTDYSSVFFDYADLERPVVFYAYDLDDYAGARGGFYLDLDELPGPLLRDQDGLAAAIRAAGDGADGSRERLRAFREKYAPMDDGHASERVLAHVFGTRNTRA